VCYHHAPFAISAPINHYAKPVAGADTLALASKLVGGRAAKATTPADQYTPVPQVVY